MNALARRIQQSDPAVLWLLGGVICVLVPHILYQSPLLTLYVFTLLFWRLSIELRYAKAPPSWFTTLLAIGTFVGITYGYHTIFGRDAGVALLVAMMCLKLMEMGTSRDFLVSVFLGYFVVITGFLFDQSTPVGLLMTTAVFILTTALISYHRTQRELSTQFISAKMGISLIFQAIPLTILLFFLFPRVEGPLWGLPEQGSSAATGLSNSMAPGQITELAFDNSVAFRVMFDDKIPPRDKLYWRGPVFTYYDGFMWQNLSNSSRKFFGEQWVTDLPPVPQVKMSEAITYRVMLEPNNSHWLLALDLPTLYPPTSYLSDNYELMVDEPVKKLKRYKVTSHVNYKLEAHKKPTNRVYRQLPQFVGPKARQLVSDFQDQVSDNGSYAAQMTALVLNYFRNEPFYYTRNPPAMLDHPVDQFLFEARRGFCEHYASAFVVLMRAAGIPARVVTGYLGGEFNSIGKYFIVRQSDAHAWAEVWMDGQGWVRVDPTAAIPPSRVEQAEYRNRFRQSANASGSANSWFQISLQQLGFLWDNVNRSWDDWVVGYTPGKQQSFFNSLGLDKFSVNGLVFLLFGGMALFIVIIALHLSGRTIRKPKQVNILFRRFCRKLARRGFRHLPSETAHAYAQRVSRERQDLAPEVYEITTLYNQVRYARAPSDKTLQQLAQRISQFRP
jgi:transglutaminase-like putative cysteine protease